MVITTNKVKWIAEKVLREKLQPTPRALDLVLHRDRFPRWVKLLHTRVHELEKSGFIPSKWALEHFVKTSTLQYALTQIDKACMKMEKLELMTHKPE